MVPPALTMPQAKLPGVVQGAMLFLAVTFVMFAWLGYTTYGDDIEVKSGKRRNETTLEQAH